MKRTQRNTLVSHDCAYFRRLADEARLAASQKVDSEDAEIAGQLALAYSALARQREAAETSIEVVQD